MAGPVANFVASLSGLVRAAADIPRSTNVRPSTRAASSPSSAVSALSLDGSVAGAPDVMASAPGSAPAGWLGLPRAAVLYFLFQSVYATPALGELVKEGIVIHADEPSETPAAVLEAVPATSCKPDSDSGFRPMFPLTGTDRKSDVTVADPDHDHVHHDALSFKVRRDDFGFVPNEAVVMKPLSRSCVVPESFLVL